MKRNALIVTIHTVCTLLTYTSWGQDNLSVTIPTIWSDVKVKDNWTPSTAPNYKEYLNGSAFGYGLNLSYSFQPGTLVKNRHFSINIGAGYFLQRFDIERFFNYDSPIYLGFSTDHYTYKCWQGLVGISYKYTFRKKHFFSANLAYQVMQSFQQEYTPYHNSGGTKFPKQVNNDHIDFGKMLSLSVGINGYLSKRLSAGLCVVVPISVRWRNDKIFDDDPTIFYRAKFSLGSSMNISYHFEDKQ